MQFSEGTYDDGVILVDIQFPNGEKKVHIDGNADGLAKKLLFINLIEVTCPPPHCKFAPSPVDFLPD